MASVVSESDNWEYVDYDEFSQVNHSFLMSLLDETQVDDCDDEKLRNVIQSLEAEIMPQYEFGGTVDESNDKDMLLQTDFDLDLHWMDLESWNMDNYAAPVCSVSPPLEEEDYGSL